jgi:hypothetical protein
MEMYKSAMAMRTLAVRTPYHILMMKIMVFPGTETALTLKRQNFLKTLKMEVYFGNTPCMLLKNTYNFSIR